jgi:hypothetical protein
VLSSRATVADTEGRNGLPYLASGDPRSRATVVFPVGTFQGNTVPLTFPAKYSYSGFSPFVVASGVEARLIQAEAAARTTGGTWLTTLNTLRTPGTYSQILPGTTTPPDTIFDTLGVTQCGGNNFGTCGQSPGGNTPSFGQPAGGFSVPAGYSVAGADTTYPAHTIFHDVAGNVQAYCNFNSWYTPCYAGDTMVVLLYVRPGHTPPPDTLWNAGTGGVSGLGPLSDPGSGLSGAAADSARVALTLRERAFWLFLTGHRQGDVRRQLRQYPQWFPSQDQVYPTGVFTGLGPAVYGTAVTAAIPGTEYLNPLYHGCLDRNP